MRYRDSYEEWKRKMLAFGYGLSHATERDFKEWIDDHIKYMYSR